MNDTLVYFGDPVKALDDTGRVGGYLVRFTSRNEKDLEGEYFSDKTYFGAGDGNGRDTLFHHGMPVKKGLEDLADHVFSPMKTRKDQHGIWAETVLNQSDEYESLVFKLVKAGKIGWSSGSSPHLVKKAADGHLDRWVISEGSLTHRPVDPMARAVPIKSLSELNTGIEEDISSVLDTDERESLSLAGLPALSKVVSPNDLKGMSERSESVETAVKEFITYGRIMGEVLKAHTARVENKVEFRFKKDGRVPAPTVQHVETMLKDLGSLKAGFMAIESDLERLQRLSNTLKAQSSAIDEHARFELWNFLRISGKTPEEFKNVTSAS